MITTHDWIPLILISAIFLNSCELDANNGNQEGNLTKAVVGIEGCC